MKPRISINYSVSLTFFTLFIITSFNEKIFSFFSFKIFGLMICKPVKTKLGVLEKISFLYLDVFLNKSKSPFPLYPNKSFFIFHT